MRSTLLAPDTLAMYQFAAVFQQGRDLPEKKLLMAVLMNAVLELQDAVASPKQPSDWRLQELVNWFFSRDRSWPVSFENLCDNLDLSADCIRHRIRALLGQQNVKVPDDDPPATPPHQPPRRTGSIRVTNRGPRGVPD